MIPVRQIAVENGMYLMTVVSESVSSVEGEEPTQVILSVKGRVGVNASDEKELLDTLLGDAYNIIMRAVEEHV